MLTIYKSYKKTFLVLFILSLVLYGNSLRNQYALDDDYVTVTNFPEQGKPYTPNNALVAKGFKGIGKILKSKYAHDGESSFEYRPVTSVSFAIEYGIFGQSPFISHLISILLYALSCCVLFCVLIKLFESYDNKESIALLASFLFLILPVHTEAVDNIKCRDELFAFLFPLLSFWYCLKACDKITVKNIALIFVFFVLGYFSKKTAIIFLAIIPLALLMFRKLNMKIILSGVGVFLALLATNILVKSRLVDEKGVRKYYHFENPMYTEHFSFPEKLMAGLKTLGFYIKFMLVPAPFRSYYGTGVVDISGGFDLHVLIALVFLALMAWLCFKTKNRILIFGVLIFLLGVLPFSNFIRPVAGVVGERLIYNASFGFVLICAILLLPLFKGVDLFTPASLLKKPVLWFMPVVLIFSVLIWIRNTQWKDKLTLFEQDIPHLEASAKANSMLGNEYFELLSKQQFKRYPAQVLVQKALNNYRTAIKNDSSFYSAYNNAGVLYFSYLQDLPTAELYLKLGIRTRPVYPQAYENLGNLYRHQGRRESALQAYTTSIKQNPKQYNAYLSAIKLHYEQKEYDKALAYVRVASKHIPGDYSLTGQEADCLFMLGKKREALQKYEEAYILSPNRELAAYLHAQYKDLGDTEKSNQYKTQ